MELSHGILILDYGSQYTLLIARKVRELGVYCEVWPCNDERLNQGFDAKGVILSGGPASVHVEGAPSLDLRSGILEKEIPVLGVCYGMQLLAHTLGGKVEIARVREYGRAEIQVSPNTVFDGVETTTTVWMSHGDEVTKVPDGFAVVAQTHNGVVAAMANDARRIYGVQFHPEVSHSVEGLRILSNFVFSAAECVADWNMHDFIEASVETIRSQVGATGRVICGLSGGVDSSVVAALLHRAIPDRLTCVLVDNGLLRHQEAENVQEVFEGHFGVDLRVVDAKRHFLDRLAGVTDPEKKRKIIGEVFIREFEKVAAEIEDAKFLAQGTLYPDVIESVSIRGPSATIKSHHNVGGLPEDLGFDLIEPLRELFKDEVRVLGRALGLPPHMVDRHPFPGPGLAVRILGEITEERLSILRQSDKIFIEALREENLYHEIWQAFAVLLPVKTVGVMGDQRTYEDTLVLRAVTSEDGMTADRANLSVEFLGRVSDRIINSVRGVNRVVYDVTSKPPGTIEWE
jgi:GMP synthase (glutamine-hydrolysing)